MSLYHGLFVRLFSAINKTIHLDKGSRFHTLAQEAKFIKYIDNINLSSVLRVFLKDDKVLSFKIIDNPGFYPIEKTDEKDFEKISRSSTHEFLEQLLESARLSNSHYAHVEFFEKLLSVIFLFKSYDQYNYTVVDLSRIRLICLPKRGAEQRNYIISFLESLDMDTNLFKSELDRFVIECSKIFTQPLSLPDNTRAPTVKELKQYCTLIEMKELSI